MFSIRNLFLRDEPDERNSSQTYSRSKIIAVGTLSSVLVVVIIALVIIYGDGLINPNASPTSSKTDVLPLGSPSTLSAVATNTYYEALESLFRVRSPQALWDVIKTSRKAQMISGVVVGILFLVAIAVALIAIKYSQQDIVSMDAGPKEQQIQKEEIPAENVDIFPVGYIILFVFVGLGIMGSAAGLLYWFRSKGDVPLIKDDLCRLFEKLDSLNPKFQVLEDLDKSYIPEKDDVDKYEINLHTSAGPEKFFVKKEYKYNLLELNKSYLVNQFRNVEKMSDLLGVLSFIVPVVHTTGTKFSLPAFTPSDWEMKIPNEYCILNLDSTVVMSGNLEEIVISLCYELLEPLVRCMSET